MTTTTTLRRRLIAGGLLLSLAALALPGATLAKDGDVRQDRRLQRRRAR